MKKKIEIKKRIDFSSMIGEISAISLENHLDFIDNHSIEGEFLLSGRYKSTAASRIEEDFEYSIPVEIELTEEVDSKTGKIDITDFYYDIVDGNALLCNIEVCIDAEEILEEDRECDGDPVLEKEIEIPHIEDTRDEEKVEEVEEVEEEKDLDDHSSFFQIDSSKETFGTFVVYIVRQNETINSILEKYHTSIEEVEKYNDLKDLSIGTKIIIPIQNEQDT